jgi:V8-like Glu-specific endopeptidase
MRFQNGRECSGTGCLFDEYNVVTAGHNIFCHINGRAVDVQVDIGYNGDNHVNLETRKGKHVAVHWEWYKNQSTGYDLAFIRVVEQFKNVEPIPWKVGPVAGENTLIQVVGYPTDILDGEKGQCMYVSEGRTSYDMESSSFMLRHKLDTGPGTHLYYQSCNVLRDSRQFWWTGP